jgi:hypothetical protein
MFVVGSNPRFHSFDYNVDRAVHFPTPGEALAYRAQMPNQPKGGGVQYGVYELLPDGRLVALEL